SGLLLFLTFYFNEDLVFPRYGAPAGRPGDPGESAASSLPIILSVVTAIVSAGGFIFSTIFAFRQDRRAAQLHSLEIKRLNRELRQKELEIERLSRQLSRDSKTSDR
ncbi:MAG TPA: hypothetical protein VF177_08535, partial [Anaerolineae bacterium]